MAVLKLKDVLGTSCSKWNDHNAPRLGASLAYYTLLSIAPLTIVIVAICGLILDKTTAAADVVKQAGDVVGSGGASTLQMLIGNEHRRGSGLLAGVAAGITLLFGASGVFNELRDSLNTIWEVPARTSRSWLGIVGRRLLSFVMVLSLGLLLLLSLLLSAAFAVAVKFTSGVVPMPAAIMGEIANLLLSLVILSVLFALIFRFVPDVKLNWADIGRGAIVTAILFMIGRGLLALYLTTAGVGSAYGAAGSLVALVVWIYYSAQIFFFGAIFTRVYAESAATAFSSQKHSS